MNHIGTREIATERLTLRRFEIEDAEKMFFTTGFLNDADSDKVSYMACLRRVLMTAEDYDKRAGYATV